MVWVHGSGEQPRLNYGTVVAPLVEDGIAVFSYDKRGVGESEGDCCTSPGKYNLVAADADGAVLAVRSHPEIDPDRVGFYGASEAGWVVPLADCTLEQAGCLHGARRWSGGYDRRGEGLERRGR